MAKAAADRQRGLGRGLSALLGEVDVVPPTAPGEAASAPAPTGTPTEVAIELLRRNPEQPRRTFTESDIEDLAASVKEKGVLQPILVRPAPGADGEWQIVAGERRWRAAQRAGLRTVPVLVRTLDDLEVLEVAIVENVQRADLNAIEEALAYKALLERFGRTQEAVAQSVGKSRSHVANTLRLLQLPEDVQQHLAAGRLSAGHARAIATAKDPSALARRIVEDGLNVRQAEALAKERPPEAKSPRGARRGRNADIQSLEQDLEEMLGLKVEIRDRGDNSGEMRLAYASLEQLDDLCRRLTGG
ncbi:MAG: ParB/RepB/Spo0J family partition protein [Pseudomonadota bacterium]|nr:ParB/RepB/Spo0J family partition protein [Pseudomonadota bacterium]